MPIFEYQCKECKSVFEKLVTGYDKQGHLCPKCNSINTEKLLSRFSGIVTGSKVSSCPAKNICEPAGHSCGGCCPMHRH